MTKISILNSKILDITVTRLCKELVEKHNNFEHSVILGLQPRGVFLANRIKDKIFSLWGKKIFTGKLDVTFYRDDFRRREKPIKAKTTNISFSIEEKKIILVDDVLYTGRTVRSAMSAITSFGRPASIELLILIDRKYHRHLPIQPDYVGKSVNTIQFQRVEIHWKEQGFSSDNAWLVKKQEL